MRTWVLIGLLLVFGCAQSRMRGAGPGAAAAADDHADDHEHEHDGVAGAAASVADAGAPGQAQPRTPPDAPPDRITPSSESPTPCFDPDSVRFFCDEVGRSDRPAHPLPLVVPAAVPFLRASQFGDAEARFTNVGGFAALLLRDLGRPSQASFAVHFDQAGGTPLRVLEIALDDATRDFAAVDILGEQSAGALGVNVLALLCNGPACALFGADSTNAAELRALPGGTVPSDLGARGLGNDLSERACVYGDGGFACFDGRTWSARQLESTNLFGLGMRGGWTALGAQGVFFAGFDDQELMPIDTGTTETLVSGRHDSSTGCWSAVTYNGHVIDSCADGLELCDGTPRFVEYGGGFGHFVDANGTPYERFSVLDAEGPIWCALPRPSDVDVIGTSHAPCGINDNWLLLTPLALYVAWGNEIFCAID